jgi:hypothetical protein
MWKMFVRHAALGVTSSKVAVIRMSKLLSKWKKRSLTKVDCRKSKASEQCRRFLVVGRHASEVATIRVRNSRPAGNTVGANGQRCGA